MCGVSPAMQRELRINYILATDSDWERINLACSELGWNKSTILKQFIHGFFRRYRDYYADAGILDAEHRGISQEQHFTILRDQGEKDLPRYRLGRPGFGVSPIDSIDPLPEDTNLRRHYNTISLSSYYFVLLRVARIVDGGAMSQLVSRIVVSHLTDNWADAYQTQIDRDQVCRYR